MLFLISSAPDTKEFKTAYKLAKNLSAKICLLQNAVYASKNLKDDNLYVLHDEINLRSINEDEVGGKIINYEQLIDLMINADKVVGLF
jgi:sulfur relay protein TusB/DsrH